MNMRNQFATAVIAAALAAAALAQQPGAAGGVVVSSEPNKVTATAGITISAAVVAIEKATRTLTLKGPGGNVLDVVASDGVKNFDQIKLGDSVNARYVESVTLELKKQGKSGASGVTVSEDAARAKPGARPAVAGARQVIALVDVVAVDPKASTVTLKGPKGNVMTLPVQDPEQFKVVKKGDQVEVTYTEALALSVEPTTKK